MAAVTRGRKKLRRPQLSISSTHFYEYEIAAMTAWTTLPSHEGRCIERIDAARYWRSLSSLLTPSERHALIAGMAGVQQAVVADRLGVSRGRASQLWLQAQAKIRRVLRSTSQHGLGRDRTVGCVGIDIPRFLAWCKTQDANHGAMRFRWNQEASSALVREMSA